MGIVLVRAFLWSGVRVGVGEWGRRWSEARREQGMERAKEDGGIWWKVDGVIGRQNEQRGTLGEKGRGVIQ